MMLIGSHQLIVVEQLIVLLVGLIGRPTRGQQVAHNQTTAKPNYLETGRQITGILDRFMSLGYDKRVRPNYGGPPVEVNVTMRILSISSVSEVMMDFTADFYFRQTWQDPRLSFKKLGDIQTLYVGAEVSKKIWLPDTFFGNEKLAYFHEATTPNVFLRIDHSGEVYRSIRLTVTSSCPMNLQYFPMDRQRCTIEAESYGYNVKDIIYRWARKETAVERDKEISLPQFDIVRTVQKYRLEELSSGTYSRLIAEIHFARRMGYYLIQIYIPSSLIVVISWVSFWLHRNASPARVQLGVTTVLTMTTLMSSTNAALPKISYVKSIDIFLGTCFVMVFAALLEYATVGYLGKRIAMRKAQIQHAQSQAQAHLFAQLQAQGAQGDPLPPITTSSAALLSSATTAASGSELQLIAQQSPLLAGQQQAALLQGLVSPMAPPMTSNANDRQLLEFDLAPQAPERTAQHCHCLHQLAGSKPAKADSAAASCHPIHCACQTNWPTDSSSRRGRPRGSTSASCQCCQALAPTSQTLPRNRSQALASQRSNHHHQHHPDIPTDINQQHDEACTNQSLLANNQCYQKIYHSSCADRSASVSDHNCLGGNNNHHHHCTHQQPRHSHHQHLSDSVFMANQQASPINLPPPTYCTKSPSAAAAAAAATFVNLHRRNKGLPPSTNPNFARFAWMSQHNGSLETIFGVRPSDIDKYSRVVFPVCFVCFQLMYWIVYLHISAFLEPEQSQQAG